MKRCPICKRTYADDGFTFCLDDGALLSAPYDPAREKPVSTLQNSGPPPTAVLPRDSDLKPRPDAKLPPTIASPVKTAESLPLEPHLRPEFESSALRKRFKPLYFVLALAIPLILGGAYLMWGRVLNCPNFVARCIPSGDKAYCYVDIPGTARNGEENDARPGPAIASLRPMLGLQIAALPIDVANVNWSTSAGVLSSQYSQATIDIKGLGGQRITVKASVTSKKWGCSQTVSTSFLVPPGPALP
jgi:hypothetical protein